MRIPGIEPDEARGLRIREQRERQGLTQQDAADAVGVSLKAYWSWEHGAVLHRPHLRVLAEELGTSVGYLLTGDGEAETTPAETDGRIDELLARTSQLERTVNDQLERLAEAYRDLARRPESAPAETPGVAERPEEVIPPIPGEEEERRTTGRIRKG